MPEPSHHGVEGGLWLGQVALLLQVRTERLRGLPEHFSDLGRAGLDDRQGLLDELPAGRADAVVIGAALLVVEDAARRMTVVGVAHGPILHADLLAAHPHTRAP